jgi:hypothetical protein
MPALTAITSFLRDCDELGKPVGPAKFDATTYFLEKGLIKRRMFCSGSFAVVVKATTNDSRNVALRLFLGKIPTQTTQITAHISTNPHPVLVPCKLRRELFTLKNGEVVDGMEMDYVQGQNLDEFILNVINTVSGSNDILKFLKKNFIESTLQVARSGFLHGDLSHGNVMVESNGMVRFVDYDSVIIEGQSSPNVEAGLKDYQHPSRGSRKDLQRADVYFSSLVIYVTLASLHYDRNLWSRHLEVDFADGLLFRNSESDLSSASTPLWKDLSAVFSGNIEGYDREALSLLKDAVNTSTLSTDFVEKFEKWADIHFDTHSTPTPVPVPNPVSNPVTNPALTSIPAKRSPTVRPRAERIVAKPSPKPRKRMHRATPLASPTPQLRVKANTPKKDENSVIPVNPSNSTSYRVDDDGTEWVEDQNGMWWYKEPEQTDWCIWAV